MKEQGKAGLGRRPSGQAQVSKRILRDLRSFAHTLSIFRRVHSTLQLSLETITQNKSRNASRGEENASCFQEGHVPVASLKMGMLVFKLQVAS